MDARNQLSHRFALHEAGNFDDVLSHVMYLATSLNVKYAKVTVYFCML